MQMKIYQVEILGGEWEDAFNITRAICDTFEKAKEIADNIKETAERKAYEDEDYGVWIDDIKWIDVKEFDLNKQGNGKRVYRWRKYRGKPWELEEKR